MNNKDIKQKKEYIEELAKDIFTLKITNLDFQPAEFEMRRQASNAFLTAEFFFNYKCSK